MRNEKAEKNMDFFEENDIEVFVVYLFGCIILAASLIIASLID